MKKIKERKNFKKWNDCFFFSLKKKCEIIANVKKLIYEISYPPRKLIYWNGGINSLIKGVKNMLEFNFISKKYFKKRDF